MIYNGIEGILTIQRIKQTCNAFESLKLLTSGIACGDNSYCVNKYFVLHLYPITWTKFFTISSVTFLYYSILYAFPLLWQKDQNSSNFLTVILIFVVFS